MKFCALLLYLIVFVTPFVIAQTQAYVLAYPGDCSKYQQCDASGCFIMSCGRGTEFNPAIGTCDYPLRDRSGCSNRG
ncbi:uncharacterized protein LOC126857368 [Cataglyphis hispanica]|uniref:uncharacterized protein LOC126857368 n=1 Tax=Cataglyphis hispanica TaxID=1086592 RepID=UPI00218006EC|nr:uncharacterized protein LOC126857368 [Cataglyphis hispanica]